MFSTWKLTRLPLIAVSVCLAGLSASDRLDAQQQDSQTPVFRTEANYVRVDVYPLANDAPVTDLQQEDFEVFEDGAPQLIEAFSRVLIRGPEPGAARIEPNTVTQSRSMVEQSQGRLFVLFLDINHVDWADSRSAARPLIDFLNRVIGADDLVGVMTPEMSGADVTFARRMETVEGILARYGWGERNNSIPADPNQRLYQECYPGFDRKRGPRSDDRGIADEMMKRYKERESLTALESLTRSLRDAREGRKAVITISNGWLLYRPDSSLARPLGDQDGSPRVGIDPLTGRAAASGPRGVSPLDDCERDRQRLAQLDDAQHLRDIMDVANRANVSFYPVDPRGLAVFDTNVGDPRTGQAPRGTPIVVPPAVDQAMLRTRIASLQDLAFNTDGLAVVNTNDLDRALRRVAADLSSYYLLGYYSTGKFDGKFHSISVRVKRPGVNVRARRGYVAPTLDDVKASTARGTAGTAGGAGTAAAAAVSDARAIETALARLGGMGRELPLRLQTAVGWSAQDRASISVIGELGSGEEWKAGGDVDLMLIGANGDTVATARAQVAPGTRGFRTAISAAAIANAREYTVQVRARARTPGVTPINESARVEIPAFPAAGGAVLIRRGQTTGGREVPTADLRFRRTDELRVEIPSPSSDPFAARLLDRSGKPLPLPITVTVREDPDGSRWQAGRLTLAPLAPGDYLIELTGADGAPGSRTLIAFRVIP
jgi:VWFA-related protein